MMVSVKDMIEQSKEVWEREGGRGGGGRERVWWRKEKFVRIYILE